MVRDRHLYLLLLPVFAYYIIFHFVPMYGVVISFKDYNIFAGLRGSEWVGLDNYRVMFRNDEFLIVLRNTLMLNVISLFVALPAPLVLALLLNEVRNRRLKRAVQGIVYLPHFLSWVVVSGLVISVLSSS